MQNDTERLNNISHNLANAGTNGYKRRVTVTRPFAEQLQSASSASGMGAGTSAVIDPAAGTIRPSASPLDLAIEGDAFFEVSTPQGPAFTRYGHFHVDAAGKLVTEQGDAVMGTTGELAGAGASSGMSVNRRGEVTQGEQLLGQVKLVRFANASALLPLGQGLYAQGGARVTEAGSDAGPVGIQPGALENSNVSSAQEMARLAETVRHFEALQKVVQGYDEALEKAIRKLGEF
ncbi:flagellar hook basal-body protein [Noviherbaspirillum sp. 17J57-3]|uniref:Flagellar hook basal-body protein n=2 Tax=Noviherbaspirillum galbum TaxID=2709383 RepID=A0A6B3SQH5_9BURK|nr:flagellar hook basal-body protein [Noviherbaspirillum galbum]